MKIKKITCAVTALAVTLSSGLLPESPAAAADVTTVTLDPSNASPFNGGRFEGWGTSMGWWGNRIGYSDKMSQQAAEDLYSEDGLSLDIVRYNVGGGDNPTHNHVSRSDSRLPCFAAPRYEGGEYQAEGDTNADVTNFVKDANGDVVYDWDWNADHDQLNVLKRIKEQNPNVHIEGYTNSPPWFMTISQCSGGGVNAGNENLSPDNYDIFADFLAGVAKHMKEIGLPFDSYSPMNEPEPRTKYWTALNNKQEGNLVAPGAHQAGLITELKNAYKAAGIDTLVAGPDETNIDYTISSYSSLKSAGGADSLDRIDTHTYGGSKRAELKSLAQSEGKNLWMSEVDKGENGFWLAQRIIDDLNGMRASAWVMWDIIDFHKDSSFIDPTTGNKTEANNSLNPAGGLWGVGMGNHDTETVEWANKYYAFGQFTRYVNPGDTLIASSNRTLAAYNSETGDIKIVVTNSGGSDIPYEFDLSAFRNVGNTVSEIRSNNATGSAAEHWANITGEARIENKTLKTAAKAGTITTYIIEGGGSATVDKYFADEYTADENGLSYSYTVPKEVEGNSVYFAVYDSGGALKYASINKSEDSVKGDFTDCSYKLLVWNDMTPVAYTISGGMPMEYAVINGGEGVLNIGETIELKLDTNISGTPVWSVDSSDIADIAQNGSLTIKKSGTVTVTAEIDGFTAEKTITVPLNITGGGNQLMVGDKIRLSGNIAPEYAGEVVWAVDNADVAEITQDGTLTIKSTGIVTVSLTVAGVTVTRIFDVPAYTLSGTPSWSSASAAPKDSDDYRKAADGDLSTYFDGVQNGWIMYDYGAPYKISRVRLAARQGHGGRTVGGKVQGSNDAIKWTDLYTIEEAIPAEQYTEVTTFANDKAYRYYRYTNPSEMTNIAEFLIEGAPSENIPEGDPTVKDITEFTDNFEGGKYMFADAKVSGLADGNIVYACGLERFANVFIPANSTAVAELREPITLGANQLFRMKFNMFAGWEDNGPDNTFALKDKDGNALVSFKVNTGASSMAEVFIGGKSAGTASVRCKSNTSGSSSVNGWNHASQPYRNYMGYNKTAEILIDGAGNVSVSFMGGNVDSSFTGVIAPSVNIKSLTLTGACKASRDRIVSYDNFDTDVITYSDEFAAPTPTPVPIEGPEDGVLISLDFNNGDLTSGSEYGKAEGTPQFVDIDGRKAAQFSNSAARVITLTDANGNGLLAGQDEITVSFSVKPTTTNPSSWWFFAAPNANEQKYKEERYIGAFVNKDNGKFKVERYNGGERAAANEGEFKLNEWNDIIISISQGKTDLYINGALASSVASSFKLSDILGSNPVAYIGRANWGATGEFATGYLDDFVIKQGALSSALDNIDLGDLSAVKDNLTLPTDGGVKWTSSNPDIIADNGAVTRPDKTTTVTLTATVEVNGVTVTRAFDVVVVGVNSSAYLFAHFIGTESDADQEQIYFSVSQTGTTWKTLNGGKPVLKSDVGEKGVRDPYILRGEDGKFFIIATDLSIYNLGKTQGGNKWGYSQTNGSQNIVVWESGDLVNWSDANLIKVAVDNAGCAWAPEAIYYKEKAAVYGILGVEDFKRQLF